MTGLARRARRGGCCRIGLDRCGDAGLAVDRAAVAACIPCNRQRNSSSAGVTFPVTIGIHMVSILITGIAASGAGFRALVLRIVRFCPCAIRIAMIRIVKSGRAAAGTSFCTPVLCIAIFAPCAGRVGVRTVVRGAVSADTAGRRSAVLAIRIITP